MKRVLPKIINNDQSGFLKGRSIAENILLNGIINYAGNRSFSLSRNSNNKKIGNRPVQEAKKMNVIKG